uniref:NADH-ubiquinone oxidoreductase chain 6 n=1 Tax=Hydrochus sp. BMNH1425167 TaxID=2558028 RepID=A0A191ZRE5_9COLE|nr:NADH dehydrogenase subunit 6 [Hydrochus sp. BMNH1425167]
MFWISTMLLMSLLTATIFTMLNHPMSMGFMLLIQTIMISTITGFLNFNWWFSYILFIIMVGGMLVLFIYMTSIASNEKFKFSYKIMMIMFMMMMIMVINMLLDNYLFEYSNNHLHNIENINNINIILNKFLCLPSNMIMFTMIIYLLITLIAVVKIADIKKGPLRQMN